MTTRSPDRAAASNGSAKGASASHKDEVRPQGAGDAAAWREQLTQKDELIQALTAQLEQAAEQLDRLHRSGADRRRGGMVGGIPGALVDDQRRAVEDLQRVVQQWEDMQAGLTLGRIEIQISELRDLISERLTAGSGFHDRGPLPHRLEIHEEPAELSSKEDAAAEDSEEESPWQKLKAELLGGDEPAATKEDDWGTMEQPLPDAPPECCVDEASREQLAEAVVTRDTYIATLLSRLRRVEALQPAAVIAQMDPESSEFVSRVQTLEQRLHEHLRAAEVELSVDRAKVARERAHMAQQQELLERQLKKLGLNSIQDIEQVVANPANVQERRWSRFLGKS